MDGRMVDEKHSRSCENFFFEYFARDNTTCQCVMELRHSDKTNSGSDISNDLVCSRVARKFTTLFSA